jgi:hypothetical protein
MVSLLRLREAPLWGQPAGADFGKALPSAHECVVQTR